jgi:hemoglobin
MSTNRIFRTLAAAGLALSLLALTPGPRPIHAQAQMHEASLYKRLGGYDALAAVTDDFIGRLASDKELAKFFAGHSSDSLHRIRQLIVDQLCAATGGPCFYTGRSMKASHEGMGITESDWQLTVAHLNETLDKFKVPARERGEVLALVSSLKKDIVAPTGDMK